jgi:hypothetical protein
MDALVDMDDPAPGLQCALKFRCDRDHLHPVFVESLAIVIFRLPQHRCNGLARACMTRALPRAFVVVLVAGCAGCGTASHSASAGPSLESLQLRRSEAPAGFYLEHRYRLDAAHTAGTQQLDPSQYARQGGGPSLAETFVLRQPTGVGLSFISAQVIAFGSSAGASWGFSQLRAVLDRSGTIGTVQATVKVGATPTPLPTILAILKHPLPPPVTLYRRVAVPPVGDGAVGFTNTSAAYAGEYVFTNQVVLFRRGRYCAIVHIAGNYNQVPMSAALSLSRHIDARMRGAKS